MALHPLLAYQRLLPVIHSLTPPGLRNSPAVLWQTENLITSSLIALIVMPAYGFLYQSLGDDTAARFCWLATGGLIVSFVLLRVAENVALASNSLIATVFCLLLGLTYQLGGVNAPTVLWLGVCPIAAIATGGRIPGLIWSAIGLLTIAALYAAELVGKFPPVVVADMRLLGVISTVSFLATIAIALFIFDHAYRRGVIQLEDALERIREEKEKAQVTLQSIGDAVITTDAHMVVEYLNPIAETLTGWTTAEAKGRHMDEVFNIFNEKSRLPSVNPIKECLDKNGIVEMENHTILVRRTDNEEFHIEDSAAPIRRADGSILGAVMVFHEVTDRKAAETRLQHIAFHDTLTGLPNRALFRKKLSEAMHGARFLKKHVAVLFLDLDRFKAINDSLGHDIGDELLILVAKRLEQCARDTDVICRLGGDEFTALLTNISAADNAAMVAGKMIESIGKPFDVQGRTLHISTSIGITIYPQDSDDLDTLLKHADTAMYHAKSQGRNNYQYYDPSMGEKAVSELRMENALHVALENNEYFLEYQPKLDLSSQAIVGCEALLRWQSPDFGRVMPSEFIPRLEESGAIVAVGAWVLETAMRQARQWLDAGRPIAVSVNVSMRQFRQNGLVEKIRGLLEAIDLPPSLLRIEITESLLMDNAERSEAIMLQLKEIGVHVSLDDFGTGYSSLSYLRRFPITELKIDRSFVVDMEVDETAEKIVTTVIDLGQALGMKVTAEGVETEKQRRRLEQMGCNEIQGYVLSRPLQKQAFEEFVVEYTGWQLPA
ncbi:putative bifunctional diguanylate cyclase/phosphodiesterase [Noviherbaspirillum malthae]|uniref:putative bifunctional diguanylate cyclase/phosphodiesterase n=1 Tax=Noviherbaspirillum malthae TaxID=1260987 RepID=UPI00189035DC|nr:EAL domain-containing protein [Noviherbaspirillum malthae]